MKTKKIITAVLPILLWGIAISVLSAAAGNEVVLMTHDSFSVSKGVAAAFEKETGATLRILKAGDAGAALNQAILSKKNPMADVFFGVDNTFLSRAIREDLFAAYDSPLLARIPEALQLDRQNRLLPVDFGDVCLNYDRAWFSRRNTPPPESLADLAQSPYAGLTVVQNPATSSPGLAFLLATVAAFGENGYQEYWRQLQQNNVLVTDGWKEAYWGHFTAASSGNRPIVVSYATSPPAEVHFSEKKLAEAPTAAVTAPGTCFRQIEFVGILAGTQNRLLAEKLIDFMLSKQFQEDIPLQMFVFPASKDAVLPPVFVKHAATAQRPAELSPETIATRREIWIEGWAEAVLH